jgi:K+-transporting ATPase ATPase A chain
MINFIQSVVLVSVLSAGLLLAWMLAPYIASVYSYDSTSRLDRFFIPAENLIYRICGIKQDRTMGWKEYFIAVITLNGMQALISFLILLFQNYLPLNPQGFPGVRWDLALNTALSISSNTNLQHYAGGSTLSYLSQMVAIQFLQFTSAATGLAVAVAVIRGFAGKARMKNGLGNFYVDFVRSLTRILLPLSFIAALIFVYLGVPQSLNGYTLVTTIQGAQQLIKIGPVASLVSIMQIGTNGGGYFGANSAYPFQNPSQASDLIEMVLMLMIPTAMPFVYGQMLGKKSRKEGMSILVAAYALFMLDLAIALYPPIALGAGMEVRFGGFAPVFWTVTTTAVTTGSVNASLSALNPLVIVSAFMGMLIQATPGGIGVGLVYMLMYVLITVFIVGLMSGRTPEYLGMKINARDIKLAVIGFLVHPFIILVPTFLAYATRATNAIGLNTGSISFTEVLYEFTSAAANNGSDFLGTAANTMFFNISTGIVMWAGRFAPIAVMLAIAGSMYSRDRGPVEGAGIKTDSFTFAFVLFATILIVVVLTFFPFLALGPLLEFLRGHLNGF